MGLGWIEHPSDAPKAPIIPLDHSPEFFKKNSVKLQHFRFAQCCFIALEKLHQQLFLKVAYERYFVFFKSIISFTRSINSSISL